MVDRAKASEAQKLLKKVSLLNWIQVVHVIAAAVIILIPLFVPDETVMYGCMAICAAILIHERFQWRNIRRLQARADQLSEEAS